MELWRSRVHTCLLVCSCRYWLLSLLAAGGDERVKGRMSKVGIKNAKVKSTAFIAIVSAMYI